MSGVVVLYILSLVGVFATWYNNVLWLNTIFPTDLYDLLYDPKAILDVFFDFLLSGLNSHMVHVAVVFEIAFMVQVATVFYVFEGIRRRISMSLLYVLLSYVFALAFALPFFAAQWLPREARKSIRSGNLKVIPFGHMIYFFLAWAGLCLVLYVRYRALPTAKWITTQQPGALFSPYPGASLTWDLLVTYATCAVIVLCDPRPVPKRPLYVLGCLVCGPVAFPLYLGYREKRHL